MRKAISTYLHVRERLHPGMLDNLARGGAQAIEIFGVKGHFDYTNKAHVREISNWFHSNGSVEFWSMHSPMYAEDEWGKFGTALNIASTERKARIDAMDEIKRAIEVAERLPFKYLVQHIGVGSESDDPRKFEATLTSIEHLRAFAKPLGVRLLVENIPNELSTPDKLVELLRTGHFDDVFVCFDLGHAHMDGGVEAAFEKLSSLVRSTHVHDNAGDRDAHLVPGEGTIDWSRAVELLRSAPQAPPILLEIEGDQEGNPEFGRKAADLMNKAWKKMQL